MGGGTWRSVTNMTKKASALVTSIALGCRMPFFLRSTVGGNKFNGSKFCYFLDFCEDNESVCALGRASGLAAKKKHRV